MIPFRKSLKQRATFRWVKAPEMNWISIRKVLRLENLWKQKTAPFWDYEACPVCWSPVNSSEELFQINIPEEMIACDACLDEAQAQGEPVWRVEVENL